MSQSTRSGRGVRNPADREEREALDWAMREHLSHLHFALFYYADQRPGPLPVLSDSIKATLEQRHKYEVRKNQNFLCWK